MPEPDRAEEYLDELEKHLDDLPHPDERSFYLLLIEMANVRAQLSMLTGLVLDLYATAKGRDFADAAERVTKGLADRQSAMREQTVEDITELLERLREDRD
jgi:hypothetical protein